MGLSVMTRGPQPECTERKGQEIADVNWGKGKDLREQRAGQEIGSKGN